MFIRLFFNYRLLSLTRTEKSEADAPHEFIKDDDELHPSAKGLAIALSSLKS